MAAVRSPAGRYTEYRDGHPKFVQKGMGARSSWRSRRRCGRSWYRQPLLERDAFCRGISRGVILQPCGAGAGRRTAGFGKGIYSLRLVFDIRLVISYPMRVRPRRRPFEPALKGPSRRTKTKRNAHEQKTVIRGLDPIL